MSEVTCPNCGAEVFSDEAPEESVDRQLTALIDAGVDSDAAAEQVVATLPESHQARMLPLVRRTAHGIGRDRVRRLEKATIGSRERYDRDMAMRRRLLATTFSLGAGIEVTWGVATIEQHQLRVKLLDDQSAGIADTKRRHMLAIEMIESTPDAKCLGDVEGSEVVIDEDASAEVDTGTSGSAREPATSADAPKATRRGARVSSGV